MELPLVSADPALLPTDGRQWTKRLVRYHQPSTARSMAEVLVTVVPFAALWALTAVALMGAMAGNG